jgi:3-dehydroquinate synthase II
MRNIWVKVDPWEKDMVTTAIEGGADGVLVPPGYVDQVKALGKVTTIAEDGDLQLCRDVEYFAIKSHSDEAEILSLSRKKKVILQCDDWSIIPLENLIAQQADVIAQVSSLEEALTAFGILEKGVRHILLSVDDAVTLKNTLNTLMASPEQTDLATATIVSVTPVGMGDRVCVDTCSNMGQGEGILVGNSSGALFLIHAESLENPYVAPRPFRVNAGAVHAYTRVPGGKTRYLSELSAGDGVLVVDHAGNTGVSVVGRLKIEKRPLMLVTAQAGENSFTTIVQNAETIRLTRPGGEAVSVVSLKAGDEVLVALEAAGRHFGHKVDETITEK